MSLSSWCTNSDMHSFFNAYNFPVIFTRSVNVFGPGQALYRIIPRTILFFLIGKTLELHGGGNSIRSFAYIGDIVDGTFKAMKIGEPGEIFHFSTDKMVSIRELVELIAKLMGVSFNDHIKIVDDRLGKDFSYVLDDSKAKKELEWNSKISLRKGIEKTIDWVTANLDELKKQPFNYIHKP